MKRRQLKIQKLHKLQQSKKNYLLKTNHANQDAELKEIVGGFIIVSADSIEEAIQMGEGCPALSSGGKVEVRDIMVFDGM